MFQVPPSVQGAWEALPPHSLAGQQPGAAPAAPAYSSPTMLARHEDRPFGVATGVMAAGTEQPTLRLRSDRPFQTASEAERRKREQAEFQVGSWSAAVGCVHAAVACWSHHAGVGGDSPDSVVQLVDTAGAITVEPRLPNTDSRVLLPLHAAAGGAAAAGGGEGPAAGGGATEVWAGGVPCWCPMLPWRMVTASGA